MPNATLEIGGRFQLLVALDKVTERRDVSLDRASKDGNPIGRQEIDKVTGELVDADTIKRGVFTADGFREIPTEAVEAIEDATKLDTFEIDHFVPLKDVPFERATAAYMLRPQKNQTAKALAVIQKALAKSKKAGVFKLTLTKRQYLAVLYAKDGGLIVNLLSFAQDFTRMARASSQFDGVSVKPEAVALATKLIADLSVDAATIEGFEDDLVPMKQRLVDEALAGRKIVTKGREKKVTVGANDDDALLAQLTASLAEVQARKPGPGMKRPVEGSSKGRQEKVPV